MRVIYNPTSGRDPLHNSERISEVVRHLASHGINARVEIKTSGVSPREQAREAARRGEPCVVVVAGDGTVEDVASELIGTETALGIIPIGTMNNVARSLGVPSEIAEACELIAMDTRRHIDMGRVLLNDKPHVEYFVEGAGLGLSALVGAAGHHFEKGNWRLMWRGLMDFFGSKPGSILVELDDLQVRTLSDMVTVANAPLMGNNLLISPDAKMDDGLFDVRVYDGMSRLDLARHMVSASKGEVTQVQTYRARHVKLFSEEPAIANSDKEVSGWRHVVEIELHPHALAVIAGNGIGLTMPVQSAPHAPPLFGMTPATNGVAAHPSPTEKSRPRS